MIGHRATARKLRIFYFAGPGDVIGTYRAWREGRADPSQLSHTYSSQFFLTCQRHGFRAHVVTTHARKETLSDDAVYIENRPNPAAGKRGPYFHLLSGLYTLRLAASIISSRSDVAVITNTQHWFLLAILWPLGVRVIPSLHNTPWPKQRRPRGFHALLRLFNGWYFGRVADAILYMSDVGRRQLFEMTKRFRPEWHHFTPTFDPVNVSNSGRPSEPPFNVCFVGRVERDKGVFVLLDACRQLVASGHKDIQFHVCGHGGAFEELQHQVTRYGLGDNFRLHGLLNRLQLSDMYASNHVVIVPTAPEFAEGINKVILEGIIFERVVVASENSMTLDSLRDVVVIVRSEDVEGYAATISRLASDPTYYNTLMGRSRAARDQFTDVSNGWAAAFEKALVSINVTPAEGKAIALRDAPVL